MIVSFETYLDTHQDEPDMETDALTDLSAIAGIEALGLPPLPDSEITTCGAANLNPCSEQGSRSIHICSIDHGLTQDRILPPLAPAIPHCTSLARPDLL